MKNLKFILFLFFGFWLSGCVTKAVQTEALLSAPPSGLPQTQKVQNIKFIDQTLGYCGPSTLAMAMNWAGKDVTVWETAKQVFTPGLKGSLQTDMVSAARRQGLMAVQIQNLDSLLQEIAAGHPVIVFENLSLSWAPNWHYALAVGYDLPKQEIILNSGHEEGFRWDLRKFERSWMLGDYWGLVVLPAGSLAASGDELSHVNAAVGLESAERIKEAELSYSKILEMWPKSLLPMIGLANIAYEKGDTSKSVALLRKAVKLHPESAIAKYNLQVAEAQ